MRDAAEDGDAGSEGEELFFLANVFPVVERGFS